MNSIELVGALLGPGGLRFGAVHTAGSLTLVPVWHDGGPAHYRTYAAAVADGLVTVEEVGGGSVPDLLVTNAGDEAVLFIEGEMLAGLKQTRTLNTTVLVPAGMRVTIPVTCVEQGRWGAAAPVTRDEFHVSPRVRHVKSRGVQASMRSGAGARSDQSELWLEVDARLVEHRASSPTRSYRDLHRARGDEIRGAMAGLRPEPDQQGVLALIGSRPAVLDVFDRSDTLATLWESLVGSYAADALVGSGAAEERHVTEAIEWVHDLAAAPATVHSGVGHGEVVQLSGAGGIVSALVADEAVVHLAALRRGTDPVAPTRFRPPGTRASWPGDGR